MYGNIPKETLAEILLYLAEQERFGSLKELKTISSKQLKLALNELAEQLKKEAQEQVSHQDLNACMETLKKPFQKIVSQLPEIERERLLKGFL